MPMTVEKLLQDFAFLQDWEDRYLYIIELGKQLPPLPEEIRIPENKFAGCVSQVWFISQKQQDLDGTPILHLSGDSDSQIVRGLMAIVFIIMSDHRPEDILSSSPEVFFKQIGLEKNLSLHRSNGILSLIARIRADACAMLEEQKHLSLVH